MLHSNSNMYQKQVLGMSGTSGANEAVWSAGFEEHLCVPLLAQPRRLEPVRRRQLLKGVARSAQAAHGLKTSGQLKDAVGSLVFRPTSDYRVDVYALHYNWLQIKDGRALLSFA